MTIFQRFGAVTCGQLLAVSIAINAIALTTAFILIAAPDDGADVPAKAAQLQTYREGVAR